jgi:cob(I)alamin adenosyltransferase
MSIATKTGDDGTTALLFGRRVSKTDPRIAANGACDELNAALGLVRVSCVDPRVTTSVLSIQKELVNLMGEIAVAPEDRERYQAQGFTIVTDAMVENLTAQIDELERTQHINYRGWRRRERLPPALHWTWRVPSAGVRSGLFANAVNAASA